MNFPPFLLPQEPETVLLRLTKAALHPAGSFRLSSLLTRSRKGLPRLCRLKCTGASRYRVCVHEALDGMAAMADEGTWGCLRAYRKRPVLV